MNMTPNAHICDLCNWKFSRHGELQRHIETHYTNNECVCGFCGIRCVAEHYLLNHLKSHIPGRTSRDHHGGTVKTQADLGTVTSDWRPAGRRGRKFFQCGVCSRYFSSRQDLKNHMEKHAAYRLYTCSFCSLDIVHYQGLLTHMRNQHSSLYKDSAKLFQRLPESDFFHFCNLCNAGFPNFETMNRHLISVHKYIFDITDKQNLAKSKSQTGTEMFSHKKASCPSCNISFENQLALSWHMFMMHMSSACKSQSIDQNNRNKSLLRLRTKTSDKSQKQKEKKNATRSRGKTSDKSQKQREKKNAIRRESFASGNESRQSVYNAKKSVGNSKAEHVNEMSGQTFIRVDSFKRHRTRVVSGQYDCICELCGKWYSRMDKLKDHIRTKHLNIRYRCDFCNVTLKARTGTMKNHMENHFGLVVKDKYPCLTCGKMLSSFDSLKIHRLIHTEKQITCHCGESFSVKRIYQYHLQTKHRFENYKCKYCEKTFASPVSLKTHERIHKDDKKFHCTICGKRFIQSYSVKVHMRVHTQTKPFHCDKCDAKYTQSYPLTLHKRKHHR